MASSLQCVGASWPNLFRDRWIIAALRAERVSSPLSSIRPWRRTASVTAAATSGRRTLIRPTSPLKSSLTVDGQSGPLRSTDTHGCLHYRARYGSCGHPVLAPRNRGERAVARIVALASAQVAAVERLRRQEQGRPVASGLTRGTTRRPISLSVSPINAARWNSRHPSSTTSATIFVNCVGRRRTPTSKTLTPSWKAGRWVVWPAAWVFPRYSWPPVTPSGGATPAVKARGDATRSIHHLEGLRRLW
jgi:hypothetical protein